MIQWVPCRLKELLFYILNQFYMTKELKGPKCRIYRDLVNEMECSAPVFICVITLN